MKQYDPSQPLIYTHVPKCAGSSVVRLLRDWFGDQYHKLNQDERRDIVLPRVETKDKKGKWLPNVKCIHGHFNHGRGYGLPYFYPELNQYFTILRDPFDLAVSMYFFAKGRSREGKFWFRGKSVNLNDQFPDVESYVKSYPYWMFDHLPQDVTLENYQQKLSSKFIFMGIFEDMQTTIDNLAKILGMPQAELPVFNVSTYDEEIPEQFRQQFYADYPLLKKVYDFAADNYQLAGYEFPADGGLAIAPNNSNAAQSVELKSNQRNAGNSQAHASAT